MLQQIGLHLGVVDGNKAMASHHQDQRHRQLAESASECPERNRRQSGVLQAWPGQQGKGRGDLCGVRVRIQLRCRRTLIKGQERS